LIDRLTDSYFLNDASSEVQVIQRRMGR